MTDDATPPSDTPPPPPQEPPLPLPPGGGAGAGPGPASQNRGIMIVLSYLWLLALVPLVVEKDDAEVQWHAKHGLVLFAAEIAAFVAVSVLSALTAGLGCFILPLLQLGILILHVMAIAKGLQGSRLIVPRVSEYADKL